MGGTMAKNLMIQGTMSGVGKSILTAGLLRIFKQDGYMAAPFKSQNMALNSFVTPDGREIGRAQALQAAAAGVMPSSDMNPILLKPTGEGTSQVIVNGLPYRDMKASEYFSDKLKFVPEVMAAYKRLSDANDIVVIEGAGSPVEINLRENDIVNMGLAEMVDAPVLLAGNIDPGGVFAQLLGTIQLMTESERKRVKGLIINRFRGDKSLLMPGLSMFGKYCDIPFAGVVPFIDLSLDEEDSLSEHLKVRDTFQTGNDSVKIAVIRLPYISNYTDFSVFEKTSGCECIFTTSAKAVAEADIIILPGTKNTLSDLGWLRSEMLDGAVLSAAKRGALIIGICGGFQMLGEKITQISPFEDDFGNGTEHEEAGTSQRKHPSYDEEVRGLGLLPIETEFKKDKTLKQVTGKIENLEGPFRSLNGAGFCGYEIHMGVSGMAGCAAAGSKNGDFCNSEKKNAAAGELSMEGSVVSRGNVLGTYVHGIFDTGEVARRLLESASGRAFPEIEDRLKRQDADLDRLADTLRQSLDMDMIYRISGL